jgi:transcriptional regulator with XRE-family HTH domain
VVAANPAVAGIVQRWSFNRHEVRRRRKALGLSQSQLAAATGFTERAIALWERGHRSPLADSVARLAGELHCLPGDLFTEQR